MRVSLIASVAATISAHLVWNQKKGVWIAMKIKKKKKEKPIPSTHARRIETTSLRFTPTAWAKLLYLRDYADSEVGAFGISDANDLLLINDIVLVQQYCSYAYVAFDDESVADFFDQQVDAGMRPEQFARIWIHTHPVNCPLPSATDEETFDRVFGRAEWAVMFILARGGQSYARLRFNSGRGAEIKIPVAVDYARPFSGSALEQWEHEYLSCVEVQRESQWAPTRLPQPVFPSADEMLPGQNRYDSWSEYISDDSEEENDDDEYEYDNSEKR